MTATIHAFPTPAPKDGGKARIRRRRDGLFGQSPIEQCQRDLQAVRDNFRWPSPEPICDLTMRHADPEDTGMPSDSAYHAPDQDMALMKISVTDDKGECFSYDTAKDSMCLHPSQAETPAVVDALREATRFLASPKAPQLAQQ